MTHIQQRRDTAANWTATNPVLYEGEVGWETDTRRAKLGDGVTAWSGLSYLNITPPVTSVAGKVGAVSLVVADVAGAAPTASPVFTGNPTAPTAAANDNDDTIATTKHVKDALAASPALGGNPTAPTPAATDSDTSIATTAFVKAALLIMNPVGTIYESTKDTNPSEFIGGTWEEFAPGRVLVGVDPLQAEFDTAGESGGHKTVTLTAEQSGSPLNNVVTQLSGGPYYFNTPGATPASDRAFLSAPQDAAEGHPNLQPYTVVYRFRRIL